MVKKRVTIKLIDALNVTDEKHSNCNRHPANNASATVKFRTTERKILLGRPYDREGIRTWREYL